MSGISKAIFLDIDGVLNFHGCKARAYDGYIGIDDGLLDKLAKLVRRFQHPPEIILTSTWKDEWQADTPSQLQPKPLGEYLQRKMEEAGLGIADAVRDADPFGDLRGHSIRSYLKEHPDITEWVVLDDVRFQDYSVDAESGDSVNRHLVLTDWCNGLTKRDMKRAVEILSGRF